MLVDTYDFIPIRSAEDTETPLVGVRPIAFCTISFPFDPLRILKHRLDQTRHTRRVISFPFDPLRILKLQNEYNRAEARGGFHSHSIR